MRRCWRCLGRIISKCWCWPDISRYVPPAVTRAYRGKIVNVHPSLLPAFGGTGMYGRHVHAAVLAAGARISGATVHFVDEVYDRGAIVAQWPVPVFEEDSPETLAQRVLQVEHALLPRVVELSVRESLALDDDGTVHGAFSSPARRPMCFRSAPDRRWPPIWIMRCRSDTQLNSS